MNQSIGEPTICRLVIPVAFEELDRLRRFCEEIVSQIEDATSCEDLLGRLQLSANEAVANVIEHGFAESTEGEINCEASRSEDQLHFTISHTGCEFSGPDETPQVDEPGEGGMGLYLIEQCTDQVTYDQADDGRQRIRLAFNLK